MEAILIRELQFMTEFLLSQVMNDMFQDAFHPVAQGTTL